jgi:mannosyltransferase OCH1-like enzyme
MKSVAVFAIIILIIILFIFTMYIEHYDPYYDQFNRSFFNDPDYVQKNMTRYLKNVPLPDVNQKPRFIQTYFDKQKIPADVYTNVSKYAPEYLHVIYDDNDLKQIMETYFTEDVVKTFLSLKEGAHRADLARYCILYLYGGLYMDIKVELIKPVSSVFTERDRFYSVMSYTQDHIHQGVIFTSPRNPLFLSLIDYIVTVTNPADYLDFCKDLLIQVQKDIDRDPVSGEKLDGRKNKYYFFQEKCSNEATLCHDGLDRLGFCCFIYDNDTPVIKTRRSTYPWK